MEVLETGRFWKLEVRGWKLDFRYKKREDFSIFGETLSFL
jgi:hypothetical protein